MKKLKFKALALAGLLSFGFIATSCDSNEPDLSQATTLSWSDGINENGRYDNSLYYRNDFESLISAADPFILYDEADGGWFYLYYTETSGGVLEGYRSRNFANWEHLGVIYRRNSSYWAEGRFWAPKVVKNPADGKYYMYTCCSDQGSEFIPEGTQRTNSKEPNYAYETKDGLYLTVLVADSPAGPFVEWTGMRENHVEYYHGEPTGVVGDEVTVESGPMFDFANAPAGWETNKEHFANNGTNIFAQLDAYPFFDENGDFYLYFIRSRDMNDETGKQGPWGVKMLDMVTPDYTTLTWLAQPGKMTVGGANSSTTIDDKTVNEGVYVQRHTTKKPDGTEVSKYYLTYSRGGMGGANYSACLAVADSPLGYAKGSTEAPNGGYVKLESKYGNPVHMINEGYDMYEATGNAMFFNAGGENFLCSLATVFNKTTPTQTSRNFIIDRVTWDYNEELGYDIPHSNGPTQASLQPAPAIFSGYKNIASEATVSATNMREGESVNKLNDDYVTIHARDNGKEFWSKDGGTTITLEFEEARSVRSIMIYNSHDVYFGFKKIDYVLVETENGAYVARDIVFPEEYLTGDVALGGAIRPGGAAIVGFEELKVKKITIKITEKLNDISDFSGDDYAGVCISEIRVLGK